MAKAQPPQPKPSTVKSQGKEFSKAIEIPRKPFTFKDFAAI